MSPLRLILEVFLQAYKHGFFYNVLSGVLALPALFLVDLVFLRRDRLALVGYRAGLPLENAGCCDRCFGVSRSKSASIHGGIEPTISTFVIKLSDEAVQAVS